MARHMKGGRVASTLFSTCHIAFALFPTPAWHKALPFYFSVYLNPPVHGVAFSHEG